MLMFDLEEENTERFLVCVHGYIGNKDTLKPLVKDVRGFTKIFLQGPIRLYKS
jgi:hypothetical protein